MVDRIAGDGHARPTVIGNVPTPEGIDFAGLGLDAAQVEQLLDVDPNAWAEEAKAHRAFLEKFGDHTPAGLWKEHEALLGSHPRGQALPRGLRRAALGHARVAVAQHPLQSHD